MGVIAYLALGSNLGDRKAHLDAALAALRAIAGTSVIRVSSYHETAPVGGPPGQGHYLNAAVALETTLSPEALLATLNQIEGRQGRVRGEPNEPRTLDLDILIYGDVVQSRSVPIVPHPRMHQRRFVLDPLAEIAADARHPVLGVSVLRMRDHVRGEPTPGRPLTGLTALVTGSTSGIGAATAAALAEDGAWVTVHGRDAPRADAVVAALARHDVHCRRLLADLHEPSQVARLAENAWADGLDILVCNAGADTLTGEAADWPFQKKLDELWAVDVRSTIQLARTLGTRMRERGRGVIVTMGWDQAETGMEGDSGELFAAAKGAIMAFSRSLAVSLAPQVRVNCVAPGWIRTAWGQTASAVWQERARREAPLGRWGTPEDVAVAVRWLCSRAASFVTGQIIRVNGGAVRT